MSTKKLIFKIFLDVPHSTIFIFIIFVYVNVIASIAYIHPVYCGGAGVCVASALTTRPGLTN